LHKTSEPRDARRRKRKKKKRNQRLQRLSDATHTPPSTVQLAAIKEEETGEDSQTDTTTHTDTTTTTATATAYLDLASDDDLSDMSFQERRNTEDTVHASLMEEVRCVGVCICVCTLVDARVGAYARVQACAGVGV
jgi:hypothetical protein